MDIKAALKNTDKSKVQIAIEVGVTPQTIRYWELGLTEPNEENEKKLKKALGVDRG